MKYNIIINTKGGNKKMKANEVMVFHLELRLWNGYKLTIEIRK